MRLIYTDEAGTSSREPVCVVAGVIVEADRERDKVLGEIRRVVREGVPFQYQRNFIFHATEIFSGGKEIDRSIWSFDDRLDFLKNFLCIPFANDLPIVVGSVHKSDNEEFIGRVMKEHIGNALDKIECPRLRKEKIKEARSFPTDGNSVSHMLAFELAMERADWFLRNHLRGEEVGAVFAEDVPQMRKILQANGLIYRDLGVDYFPQMQSDKEVRDGTWSLHEYRIEKIIEQPNFVSKKNSQILQLADACAFSFRRYLSKKEHGEDLLNVMLGSGQAFSIIGDKRWQKARSGGLFVHRN